MPSKQEFKRVLLDSFKGNDEVQSVLDSLTAGNFSGSVEDIFSALTGASGTTEAPRASRVSNETAATSVTSVFAGDAGRTHKIPLRALWLSASRKCIPNAASGGYI